MSTSFIVRRIVQPPERPDDPLPEKVMEGAYIPHTTLS